MKRTVIAALTLLCTMVQGAKNIVLNFGDDATTSLILGSQNPSDGDNDAYYDLQGRRVSGSSTLPKGIYIHNGKKIIK